MWRFRLILDKLGLTLRSHWDKMNASVIFCDTWFEEVKFKKLIYNYVFWSKVFLAFLWKCSLMYVKYTIVYLGDDFIKRSFNLCISIYIKATFCFQSVLLYFNTVETTLWKLPFGPLGQLSRCTLITHVTYWSFSIQFQICLHCLLLLWQLKDVGSIIWPTHVEDLNRVTAFSLLLA